MQGLSLSVTALCGKLIAHVDIDPITFPLGQVEEGQAVCCPHVVNSWNCLCVGTKKKRPWLPQVLRKYH